MKKTRLLLPFTHGVRADALEYAVLMAQSRNATLVPFSIIRASHEHGAKGPRLEHIQQSKDFLATVAYKALKHGVAVEQQEVFASDPVACIQEYTQTLKCDGVLLLIENGTGVLLQTSELKRVVASVTSQVHIIRIQSEQHDSPYNSIMSRLAQVFSKGRAQQARSEVMAN